MRIAVGGIHVECSTYNPVLIREHDFTLLRGSGLLASPYFAFLADYPAQFAPALHARAIPGGPVARDVYDQLKGELLAGIAAAAPLDGVYLAMHGAMFVEGLDDAEGDLIGAVRRQVGAACPIAVSYDLHGNVTQAVVDAIDIFSAYRTAPHIDVEATMRRSVGMLVKALTQNVSPFVAWCPIPVLLAGEVTSTVDQPARRLYDSLGAIDARAGVWDASLMVGYVWADEPRATAAAVLTGVGAGTLQAEAAALAGAYWAAREQFGFGTAVGTIAECVERAIASPRRPFVIADSGDNPTGGGVGDRPDVLRELLRRGAAAILAGIADRPAVELAYAVGVGGRFSGEVGAALDPSGGPPARIEGEVVFLAEVGDPAERQAVVRVGGVLLVLTARRRPFHHLRDFTALGLDPAKAAIVVVKSGYLSPEMSALAADDMMALSPGVVDQDIRRLPRRRKAGPAWPFDLDFAWTPAARCSARRPPG
ncbi:MAG TPA: M81 family metallopeptidase [Caulobacteraceae bacterium]|jgi:microcystin degradation protein MlrC